MLLVGWQQTLVQRLVCWIRSGKCPHVSSNFISRKRYWSNTEFRVIQAWRRAIAGIVIGVVAGLAVLALLIFFVLRRKRAGSRAPVGEEDRNFIGMEAGRGSLGGKQSSNLHNNLASLNHKPSGLDWKEGDDIKSAKKARSEPTVVP